MWGKRANTEGGCARESFHRVCERREQRPCCVCSRGVPTKHLAERNREGRGGAASKCREQRLRKGDQSLCGAEEPSV